MRRRTAARFIALTTVMLAVLMSTAVTAASAIGFVPVAAPDHYVCEKDATLGVYYPSIGLLANDWTWDGQPWMSDILMAFPPSMVLEPTPTTAGGVWVPSTPRGTFQYATPAEFTGVDTFTYWCWDPRYGPPVPGLNVSVQTVTIDVVDMNRAPVASDGALVAWKDEDCDGRAEATDADGDTMAFSVSSPPSHGDVVMDAYGSYVYTPDPGYEGDDSFVFEVTDGPATDTGVISITVNPPNYLEQSDGRLAWGGTWSTLVRASASGGSLGYSPVYKSYSQVTFNGVACEYVVARTTSSGKANIYVDGVLTETVDLYSSTNQMQSVSRHVHALHNGPHTLRIEVAGGKNPKSAGYNVMVDAVRCWGVPTGGHY